MVYEDLSIDFCRTKFPPKSRYGVQTRLQALEPAIIIIIMIIIIIIIVIIIIINLYLP